MALSLTSLSVVAFAVLFSFQAEARSCNSRGEFYKDIQISIPDEGLSKDELSPHQRFALERRKSSKDQAEFWGRILAKKHCQEKGLSQLHAFYWERVKGEGHKNPYAVTQVVCSNILPKNRHGQSPAAEAGDDIGRQAIAHHLYFRTPKKYPALEKRARQFRNVCKDIYTQIDSSESGGGEIQGLAIPTESGGATRR